MGITDSSGTVLGTYRYDAWGALQAIEGAEQGSANYSLLERNPFRYRGYFYDKTSGLYYLNSRYYSPELKRFISADSQLNNTASNLSCNLFAYCENNPISLADSNGTVPFLVITAAIGAVVGAAAGGLIAASQGGNIWAGIGIGAAAGALIGAGVGAAAGIALAGSALASTSAVAAGAGNLVAAIGTGGLSAGAKFIASNVSGSTSEISTKVTTTVSQKMQWVREKGKIGEIAANIEKNTERISSLTGTAHYRIPDGLIKSEKLLIEVKNYTKTLSYTNQLNDYVLWAQREGYQIQLYTDAPLSAPLQQIVDSGIIQVVPLFKS